MLEIVDDVHDASLLIQVKELKFRPNTDDHDYDFKKNHAIRFLKDGNRVKAVVQFRGREIAHTDLGRKLLLRFVEDLAGVGTVEGQPRMEGKATHVIISPVKAVTGGGSLEWRSSSISDLCSGAWGWIRRG